MSNMRYGEEQIKKASLEAWENSHKDRDYTIMISYPEFTCLCPRSGYPDFAEIKIEYIPDEKVVELKSLKLWLNSFRNEYISHEAVTNIIYDELIKLLKPRSLEVIGDFFPRGNVHTFIKISSEKS